MATLAIQNIDNDGLTPVYVAAAAGGDKVIPGQGSYIHVKNASAGSINVIVVTPETVDGDLTVQDRTVAVAAGTEMKIAVGSRYRNPADGLASLTYSAVTSLTLGSFRAPVGD